MRKCTYSIYDIYGLANIHIATIILLVIT